jgi:hypothetical protein
MTAEVEIPQNRPTVLRQRLGCDRDLSYSRGEFGLVADILANLSRGISNQRPGQLLLLVAICRGRW